jgi:hypothetical protein
VPQAAVMRNLLFEPDREPGLVIDFNRSGKPIGIEITAPAKLSAVALNRVLRRFDLPPVTRADLAPLRAA